MIPRVQFEGVWIAATCRCSVLFETCLSCESLENSRASFCLAEFEKAHCHSVKINIINVGTKSYGAWCGVSIAFNSSRVDVLKRNVRAFLWRAALCLTSGFIVIRTAQWQKLKMALVCADSLF